MLSWNEARTAVKKVNAKMAKLIDDISPSQNHKVIRIRYYYGETIIDQGRFNLPESLCSDEKLAAEVNKLLNIQLTNSCIPMGLLLNKSSEIFITSANQRIVPVKLLPPGTCFGLFELINHFAGIKSAPPWSVAAGAIFNIYAL